ncbi:MAG: alpha/beta hydrolase [Planctomycetes bacterium]|jgi:pimeloyl-ACP methyl ester carboxylesterase|nr:alpha/beta hydrolase [Planctomycetota bacterium]MDP6409933.1 alpha/beta fold hydrolase [Planctomycetota bacterium]
MSESGIALPGLGVVEHEFRVPLVHGAPERGELSLFAREIVARGGAVEDRPWLVFLQGGPGFESPRPPSRGGWIGRAVAEYRVLLLDQRGTGRSSRACTQSLARFDSPGDQAEYLTHFRADSIVRDAELLRRELLGGDGRWSVLGQSFGGFCAVHYLSTFPESLREVYITGGLPSLSRPAEDVYRATYPRVLERNRRYYERYPADVDRVRRILEHLEARDVHLPGGGSLTPRRFQQLGLVFGQSDGFEQVHYLVEDAFVCAPEGAELSYAFLSGVERAQPFDANPLYALLHEACYAQEAAPAWAAERVRSEHPEFDAAAGGRLFFTGEMVYPWMFAEYEQLRPLGEAAHLLAERTDWPRLYDPERLAKNEVPCVAVIYDDDMYVERSFSLEAARAIGGLRAWITNEYEHNGLRVDGELILGRMIEMMRGER